MSSTRKALEHIIPAYSLLPEGADTAAAAAEAAQPAQAAEAAPCAEVAAAAQSAAAEAAEAAAVFGLEVSGSARHEAGSVGRRITAPGI
jgi:hypothetical protein